MKRKFLIILFSVLLLLNVTNALDRAGHEYFDKSIRNAAAAFLIARGINAAISVIQDADIMASPAGIGLSVSPGEVLDPLNDLIERFSAIMLVATASLGIQKLLLVFSGWWFARLVLSLLLIGLIALSFPQGRRFFSAIDSTFFYKVAVFLLVFRFLVPFISVSNGIFEYIFLNEKINNKIESIQIIEKYASETEGDNLNLGESWITGLSSKAKEMTEIKEKALNLKEKLSNSVDNIIDLIALFIIQTILFPIAFLWLCLKSTKYLMDAGTFFIASSREDVQTPAENPRG